MRSVLGRVLDELLVATLAAEIDVLPAGRRREHLGVDFLVHDRALGLIGVAVGQGRPVVVRVSLILADAFLAAEIHSLPVALDKDLLINRLPRYRTRHLDPVAGCKGLPLGRDLGAVFLWFGLILRNAALAAEEHRTLIRSNAHGEVGRFIRQWALWSGADCFFFRAVFGSAAVLCSRRSQADRQRQCRSQHRFQ